DRTWLPVLRRMGAQVSVALERHGFHPAGGGRFVATIDPVARLEPITLLERGPVTMSARALVSGISEGIAGRELRVVHERLGVAWDALEAVSIETSPGPGNALLIAITPTMTEVVTGFGEKNVGAGAVAGRACAEALAYIEADVPVGTHLADQVLMPLALAGGGAFRTLPLSTHATTNIAVLRQFLDVDVVVADEPQGTCLVTVTAGQA
ncbi:MAG TPA: RNA 3'-terminal phosphate cyclase, partial [Luteitalea sp.]|nr:RNA 3'-terminal phosphate cyclase [Luteitalea sp.]